MLQGGGLQKGEGLCLALRYQVCDVVFRTQQDRKQESLSVKQSKDRNIIHSLDMGAGTSGKVQ
jgi:hypothetical protein